MIVFFVRTTEEMAHLVHNIESQEYSMYLCIYCAVPPGLLSELIFFVNVAAADGSFNNALISR